MDIDFSSLHFGPGFQKQVRAFCLNSSGRALLLADAGTCRTPYVQSPSSLHVAVLEMCASLRITHKDTRAAF